MTRSYTRHRFLVAGTATLALPLLAACQAPAAPAAAPTAAPAQAKPLQKLSVRLCWLKSGEFASLLNASAEGFYQAEGLEVDLRQGGAGIDPLPLVAGKSEEFGVVAGSGQLIAAVVNGKMPLKFIGTTSQKSPSGFMYLLKEGEQPNKRTPKDWKGAKVGVQAEGIITVRVIANQVGLTEEGLRNRRRRHRPRGAPRRADRLLQRLEHQPGLDVGEGGQEVGFHQFHRIHPALRRRALRPCRLPGGQC